MFPPRSTLRPVIACMLASALVVSAMSGPALARPTDAVATPEARQDLRSPDTRDAARAAAPTSSLAGTTSKPARQDLRSPDTRDAANAERIALAQERYYSSYGEPEPLTAPAPPAPVDDDTPWLPIALAIAATLAIGAAGGAQLHRLRLRRRRAARVAA